MKRILIVEDEPSIAMVLEDDLRREGYQTEVVADGDTAASRAISERFDLILLDVMLPRKDGFDVCRDVRRAGVETPIVLLTARAQEAEKVLGLELGADDYITKPYSARELRARVKAHLRRGTGSLPEVYRFGDGELDFTRCELRRGWPTRRTLGARIQIAGGIRAELRPRADEIAIAGPSLGIGEARNGSRSGQPGDEPTKEDRAGAREATLSHLAPGHRLPVRWRRHDRGVT